MGSEKHLLVDGANVLYAWPELRAVLRRDRSAARSRLIQRLIAIHDVEGIRVTVVFDGCGAEMVVERPAGPATFSVVSTPAGTTADDVIEQVVGRSADPGDCHVATGDQAERQTITASGAHWVSPGDLAAWVARAEERVFARVAGIRRAGAAKWRGSTL
jgi:hypothetical protein